MFIGSINRYMRAVLEAAAGRWKGLPVYVACSGNFTVERILAMCGVGAIHSNDVSIYSCALGWHLANTPQRFVVKAQDYSWLEPYLDPGPAIIATLLLAGEMLKVGGDNAYAKRMREEYRRKWPQLHAKTVERVKKATGGMSIASYFAGDCREFLAGADKGAVCISFPPTYKGGYERLYKKLDAIFDWPRPSYQVFSPEDFEQFSQTVRSFGHWMISSDTEQPALAGQHVATVQTSMLSKPVFMYSDGVPHRLATARQNVGHNRWAPRTDEAVEPIQPSRVGRFLRLGVVRTDLRFATICPSSRFCPRGPRPITRVAAACPYGFRKRRGSPRACPPYITLVFRPEGARAHRRGRSRGAAAVGDLSSPGAYRTEHVSGGGDSVGRTLPLDQKAVQRQEPAHPTWLFREGIDEALGDGVNYFVGAADGGVFEQLGQVIIGYFAVMVVS
jgi:hypothetical protein